MNWFPKTDIAEATRLTRAGRLKEATDILMGRGSAGTPKDVDPPSSTSPKTPGRTIDLEQDAAGTWTSDCKQSQSGSQGPRAPSSRGLIDMLGLDRSLFPNGWRRSASVTSARDEGVARSNAFGFTNAAGTRPYKLFVPSSYTGVAMPLIVMMHGCTQSPDDFAAGTQMNAQAEARGFMVAYPGQTRTANPSKCWNWFNDADQHRDEGEPSLIAGITRQVMAEWAVDSQRVFIAGFSAGGAQAAVMGAAYPDLFAAVGVHSGLACGAARDLLSGMAAMRNGATSPSPAPRDMPPTIVFHGDKDTTVAPINGDQLIEQVKTGRTLKTTVITGQSMAGKRYTRWVHCDSKGNATVEHWLLHGVSHSWSGGNSAGSFTDPEGPDASAAMVAFFLRAG